VISSFSPNLIAYAACRFLLGFCLGGTGSLSYILMLENSPTSARGHVSVWMNAMFAIGLLLLVPLAYLLRDASWRVETLVESIPGEPTLRGRSTTLTLTLTLFPGLCMLLCYPCVDESPRWLLLHNRAAQAGEVLKLIEAGNGSQVVTDPLELPDHWEQAGGSILAGVRKILRPSLGHTSLRLFFCWFTVTLVYYGLSFSADALSGPPPLPHRRGRL
jgi:OCT family organic cation transporter-like MFS transporter 4/5